MLNDASNMTQDRMQALSKVFEKKISNQEEQNEKIIEKMRAKVDQLSTDLKQEMIDDVMQRVLDATTVVMDND